MKVMVAGIGTDIGKTVVSAVLVKACQGEYWKPIQCGEERDTDRIKQLVPEAVCHKESYLFSMPASPHQAAGDLVVEEGNLQPPPHKRTLIIEPAGGLMVPLRHDLLFLDWAKTLEAEWVLVSRYYLGSINHTLLSHAAIKDRRLRGIIFVGEKNEESRDVILKQTGLPLLAEFPLTAINEAQIALWADRYKENFAWAL